MDERGFWWCPACKYEVLPQNVTFSEHHDNCGARVEWIDIKTASRVTELQEDLAAAHAELAAMREYQSFCPECGSKNIFSPINRTEKGHLACKDCKQEFFTTVIYADCIAEKLSKMKAAEQRAKQAEAQCAAAVTRIRKYREAIVPGSFSAGFTLDYKTAQYVLMAVEDNVSTLEAGKEFLAELQRYREALREIGEAKDASATWVQDLANAALLGSRVLRSKNTARIRTRKENQNDY